MWQAFPLINFGFYLYRNFGTFASCLNGFKVSWTFRVTWGTSPLRIRSIRLVIWQTTTEKNMKKARAESNKHVQGVRKSSTLLIKYADLWRWSRQCVISRLRNVFYSVLWFSYLVRIGCRTSYSVLPFQESLDVMCTNDENTLGFTLELYCRYMEAARVCRILPWTKQEAIILTNHEAHWHSNVPIIKQSKATQTVCQARENACDWVLHSLNVTVRAKYRRQFSLRRLFWEISSYHNLSLGEE